jgi:hypothetical protein
MKYVLLIYSDLQVLISVEPEQSCEKPAQVGSNPRQHLMADARVGVRDDTRLVTDGPFAETHEQLRG